jgi:hypothetical protein
MNMGKKRKSILLLAGALLICFMSVQMPAKEVQAAGKTYYLLGFRKGVGVPEYNIKLYLKKNSIVIKGDMQKYTSKKDWNNGENYKKVKYKGKKFKVSSKCKIVEREDRDYSYKYKSYLKQHNISGKSDSACICTRIIIKNGKVVKIIFSA